MIGIVVFATTAAAVGPPAGVDTEAWDGIQEQIFIPEAKLLPKPGLDNTYIQFGTSVAIDGELMVVGRLGDAGLGPIAAHIFHRDEGGSNAWGQVAEIAPTNGISGEKIAVAISGDTVIIGVPQSTRPGLAFVFQRDHGGPDAWDQVAVLVTDDQVSQAFGTAVAISGDTAVVGPGMFESAHVF